MDRQTPPQALLFPAEVMQNFASQPEVQLRAMKRLLRTPEQQLGREPVRPFPAQEMPHSAGLWGALPLPHAPPQCPHSGASVWLRGATICLEFLPCRHFRGADSRVGCEGAGLGLVTSLPVFFTFA